MYITLFIFLLGIFLGMFILYIIAIFPSFSISIENLAQQSKLIDAVINQILIKCHADRVLLFQVKNGEYFESGAPLMKLLATNEAVNESKGIKHIKHCIKGVPFQYWGNVLEFIALHKMVTLSKSNQYEGFYNSERALKKRGMGSGVYFKICKKNMLHKKMTGILCVEWQAENPPFDAEFALKVIQDEFIDLTNLINQLSEFRINHEKIKRLEFV